MTTILTVIEIEARPGARTQIRELVRAQLQPQELAHVRPPGFARRTDLTTLF